MGGRFVGILTYQSMSALLNLGEYTTSKGLGFDVFNNPWTYQVNYGFPPPALVPLVLSKFPGEHVAGQLGLLILAAPCWMEAPWFLTVPNMLKDTPLISALL